MFSFISKHSTKTGEEWRGKGSGDGREVEMVKEGVETDFQASGLFNWMDSDSHRGRNY